MLFPHNIANKNTEVQPTKTETFTNFRTARENCASVPARKPYSTGEQPYIEQLANEKSQLGYLQGRASGLGLGTGVQRTIHRRFKFSIAKFFNSFRELSNPSMAHRIAVKEGADLLTRDFQRVSEQLADIRGDANNKWRSPLMRSIPSLKRSPP